MQPILHMVWPFAYQNAYMLGKYQPPIFASNLITMNYNSKWWTETKSFVSSKQIVDLRVASNFVLSHMQI